MVKARLGVHVFSHSGTDWTTWHTTAGEQDKVYRAAKRKVGPVKNRKTPYRYVKKVTR